MAKKLKVPREEALAKLKKNYDGCHFTWPSPDIYNPYSLLHAFADGKIDSYWFGSDTPTYLIGVNFDMERRTLKDWKIEM